MIVKGTLKNISTGYYKRAKNNLRSEGNTDLKFDYINIGEYSIRDVTVSSYLRDIMHSEVGKDIEVSILNPKFIIPKTIVALKSSDGKVYRKEQNDKLSKGIGGYLIIGFISFFWLMIPYAIIYFSLMYLINGPIDIKLVLGLHIIITILLTNYLKKAYNAFGEEHTGFKKI